MAYGLDGHSILPPVLPHALDSATGVAPDGDIFIVVRAPVYGEPASAEYFTRDDEPLEVAQGRTARDGISREVWSAVFGPAGRGIAVGVELIDRVQAAH